MPISPQTPPTKKFRMSSSTLTENNMVTLGINEAHNSSAALAIDGKIVAAAEEERFVRVKNQFGVPFKAIQFCLNFAKISPQNIVLVVFSGGIPQFITTYRKSDPNQNNTTLNLL